MLHLPLLRALLAPLFCFSVDGAPVRLGVPVPAAALARGLALRGPGVVQWRRLPVPPRADGAVWIELAVVAPRGRVEVVAGGEGPCEGGRGPAFVRDVEERRLAEGVERRTVWRWCDGTVDVRARTTFSAGAERAHEAFDACESLTVDSAGLLERGAPWWREGEAWARGAGLLPPRGGGGATAVAVRRRLAQAVDRLVELPGLRGAGDFARGDGTVTNLEFDTTLALLRAAVGLGSERAFVLASRAARQTFDRDLDPGTGLPFVHGSDHRVGAPETGHVWAVGLCWVGLLTADDELVVAAQTLARALAARLPAGDGRNERLRDYAWPLHELEALHALAPSAALATAADRLAASILARFDPACRSFRFGEGELGGGAYLERGWLVGGLLLPALDAHLRRRPSTELSRAVAAARAALEQRVGSGGGGLPTHWRVVAGAVRAEHRERGSARAMFLLDGLERRDLTRVLARGALRAAFGDVPGLDDPDLATSFTLVARCDWVWR